MSPSRPFILRPVATSLLMAAILLVGIVAYTQLPVSALPEVDYPTIQVLTFYPGASPDVVATTVTAPLERQFGEMQGLSQMTSTSSGGISVIVLQFNLSLNIDVAEEEVQSAINAAQSFLPVEPARAAGLQQDQSRRRAGADTRRSLRTRCRCRRWKIWSTRGWRRRSRSSAASAWSASAAARSRRCASRPIPAQLSSYGINLEDAAHGAGAGQRQRRQGQLRRPAPGLPDRRQRSADHQRATTRTSWSPTATARRSCCTDVANVVDGVENTKQAAWMNQTPGGHPQYPAPARRQHHQRGQEHQEAAAAARGQSARGHPGHHADRPDHRHPGLGRRRRIRTDADHRPGGAGDLPLPAQSVRHHHPQRGRAAVAGRHVRARCMCSATASTTSR